MPSSPLTVNYVMMRFPSSVTSEGRLSKVLVQGGDALFFTAKTSINVYQELPIVIRPHFPHANARIDASALANPIVGLVI